MALNALPSGTRLARDHQGTPRYVIERELGAGGFGITYLAHHLGLERPVVIKELACEAVTRRGPGGLHVLPLPQRESASTRVLRRFMEEARLLSRLSVEKCPHLVAVSDVFEENGTAYYVMDRINGRGHLSGGPVQPRETTAVELAIRLGRELLVALSVVHRYAALHGDIKPGNLLFDEQGRLVLIDFGAARSEAELLTSGHTVIQTPGYSPIELVSAARIPEAGPWSDLYSWGLVVYGMLVAHPLTVYDGDVPVLWPVDAVTRLTSTDPYTGAAQTLMRTGLPAPLAQVVERCLAIEPQQRPRSVAEVLGIWDSRHEALGSLPPTVLDVPNPVPLATPMVSGQSTAPQLTGLGSSTPASSSPRRSPFAFAAVALLLVVGGVVVSAMGLNWLRADDGTNLVDSVRGLQLLDENPSSSHSEPVVQAGVEPLDTGVAALEPYAMPQAPLPVVPVAVPAPATPLPPPPSIPAIPAMQPAVPPPAVDGVPVGMVRIPEGTFTMGSPAWETGRSTDEAQHVVQLNAFFIDTHEVTQGDWARVMSTRPSYFGACGDSCPVERVSWFEALQYANERSSAEGLSACYGLHGCTGPIGTGYVTGSEAPAYGDGPFQCRQVVFFAPGCNGYRLPTEAEWEYAARAGGEGATYASPSMTLAEIAVYGATSLVFYQGGRDCSEWAGMGPNSTCGPTSVGQRLPNAWGLYDMLGNLWEWTEDGIAPYPAGPVSDPRGPGPAVESDRVRRGGSYDNAPAHVRAANRYTANARHCGYSTGFRLARSAR